MKHTPILLFILCFLLGNTASAQRNYPVRATVQYTPPYSLFLGDYATPKLIITLTGQDLLDANCPYKLSFSLECQNVKVTTKPSFNPAPLYINGGQTIVLTGADLARYFDIQNLDFHGITAAKYLQDGQLPEGFYRMNVKVIHYHENRVISNTAFTMFNARMGKPPVLSLPKNKTLIPPAQQQSPIVFTWIPKTVGAFNYKFELWECAVPGIPVQTVVSTVRPIYSQTYTTSQISFHPATVNMKPGMEYAWRITVEDQHNQQKFANQGQSEIFTFTYKRKPEPVTGLRFTNRGLKITWTWDMDPAHTKYYFEYYDPQTGRTIDPVACDYAEFVRNMPQTGYHLKARVRAECYGDPTLMSDYTPYLDTYLEPIPVPEYECGKVFEDREITNLELKHTFSPGEIVESKNGDTRYEIIFSEEKNGYLSGQFYMIMDCWGGAKIKCEFSKTQINTDNIVLNTIFHNVPDSTLYIKPETIRKEIQEAFFDAATVLTDFSIKDTVKLDKPYTYLYVNESGKVVAVSVNNNGKTEEKTTEISATSLKENTLIQGKNGEELVLTKKGQVMGKTEFNATGGNSVLLKEYHRKSDSLAQWQINFSKYDAQTYAFDHIGSGNHGIFSGADYYPQVGSYDFRYKSVECGKNDKVIVEFGSYPQADSVVFKDKYGVTYPISSKDNVLSFTGVSKADTNYIYAYRGDKKIGKLFLNTYQKKTYKVVLISVNKATLPNTKDLENYLNKVYNQCAVSFEIVVKDLKVDGIENFTHGGTKVAGSVWNASQKAVLEAFGEKYEDNTAYLFFIPKAETGGVAGYMPRYYPYGFIYPGAANRTIAHELGHGIAGLEHPFPESQVSGSTQNLMDYRDGEELWHFQWDMLQDPARKIFKWWQNEEGAESQGEPEPSERNLRWYKIPDSPISGIFLAPSRLPIWINDVQQVYVLESSYYGITVTNDNNQRPDDAIYGFKTSNGESFIAHFSNSDEFGGFYNDDVLYIDKEQKTFTNYGVYGNPIRYWSISDGKLNDTYNQSIAHKLPKGDAWGNYCAVINSIFDYISKLDLSDKAIWHPLENHISGIFIAPSKLPIWIDNVTQIYVLNSFGTGISLEQSPSEAIYGFKTSGGETFVARFSTSDKFEGFYNGDTRYVDKAKNTITKFGYEGNPIHYWVAYAFQSETEPKGELKTAQGTQGYTIPVPSNGAWDNYSAIVNESDYYEVYLGKLGQPISGMFLAPSDMPIWIDNVTDVYLSKPQNAIYGFKTANNETYFAKFSSNEFNGFYNFGTNKLYVDKNTFTLKAYGEKGYPIYFWDNSISNLNNTNSKFIAHKLPMDIYSDDNYSAVPHIPLYFEPQTADDMYCYVLYRRYRDTDSPLFNDQVWRTAIENNPCVLRGIVKFNPNMDKSEWMKEFDRFVNISMDVALIPAIIDILIVPVIDELGEYAIKRIIEQFGKDVVIKELLKKKGKDFLEGVGQKIVERILFWAINEAVKRWDCQKNNKLYQFTSYFDFEFASSELVCNYVVMLIESGLSNMISLKETQMWELFLTKCYVDCISVSQDWCDKLILCVEKNDFSWLEANILNCVINVLIGNMINSDFVVGFKSRFAIGVAADLAQDGFRELFKSWLSDVYGDSNGDEIFKEKSNNQ